MQYRQAPVVEPQLKFNYAWALVRSAEKRQQQEGVQLLHGK